MLIDGMPLIKHLWFKQQKSNLEYSSQNEVNWNIMSWSAEWPRGWRAEEELATPDHSGPLSQHRRGGRESQGKNIWEIFGARKAGRLPSQCLCLFSFSKPKSGVSRILVLFPLEADHAWGQLALCPKSPMFLRTFSFLEIKSWGFVKMKWHSSQSPKSDSVHCAQEKVFKTLWLIS